MDNNFPKITDPDFAFANPVTVKEYQRTQLAIRIENSLGVGEENAIKMKDLRQKLGKPDRLIRKTIEQMKRDKFAPVLILSSQNGYWIAKDFDEVKDWANFMISYVADFSHTVKCVVTSAENKYQKQFQLPLFML